MLAVLAMLASGAGCSGDDGDIVRSDDGPTPQTENTAPGSTTNPTTTAAEVEPSMSPALQVVGTVTIPDGTDAELEVVLSGAQVDAGGALPVVVRNGTASPLYNIESSGTARGADGSLAGSGSSQGFEPAVVGPGEWAFGYVYFSGAIPAGAQFELTATGDSEAGFAGSLNVTPAEVNLVPDQFTVQQVVGIVSNENDEEVSGPVSVQVACFNDAGTGVLSTHLGFADNDKVPAGGTSSFSVPLFDAPCPNYVVGASGWAA